MGIFNRLLGKRETAVNPPEFRELLEKATNHLRTLTAAHDGAWRLSEADWGVDQGVGEIVFTSPSGISATAPVQIIGTYNTQDSTWLWGWDHPSVEAPLAANAKKMRAYGEKHSIPDLTTRKLTCSDERCWDLTAVACLICDAQGAYRGPAGSALIFMTFGEVSLSNAASDAP